LVESSHGLISIPAFWITRSLPSGELTQQWKMAIYSGFSHWKWWFSIAMLVHQRVQRWFFTHTITQISSPWCWNIIFTNIYPNKITQFCR
jgi:hypothetical protein